MSSFWFAAARACGLGLIGWIFPRLLVALGIPLDRWIVTLSGWIFGAGNALTSESALWVATVILAATLITVEWWWHPVASLVGRRAGRSRRQPSRPRRPASKDEQKEITRDVWLSDAIWRAFSGKWERPVIDLAGPGIGLAESQRLHDLITQQIRQLCFEGKLPVWGKPRGSNLWQLVPTAFWKDHLINYLTIIHTDPEKMLIESERDYRTADDWQELMTSRTAVEKLWPKD